MNLILSLSAQLKVNHIINVEDMKTVRWKGAKVAALARPLYLAQRRQLTIDVTIDLLSN